MNTENLGQIADLVVAALGALVTILGALAIAGRRLAQILHELKPNSGGSLRDSVDRTEAALSDLDRRFVAHVEEHHRDMEQVRKNTEALMSLAPAPAKTE